MAVKRGRKATKAEAVTLPKADVKLPKWVAERPAMAAVDKNTGWEEGEPLDPQEEKVLDWILKGVVWFILGWLGFSILLVIGGFFHLWG